MTIIVYRDGVLASDSSVWVGDIMVGYAKKVHKSPQGALLGCCGSCPDIEPFQHWFMDGMKGRPPIPRDKFTGLIILPSGQTQVYGGGAGRRFEPFSTAGDFAAAGYGQEFALGCLYAGKSARATVKLAIGHVAFLGGKVQSVSLHSRAESRK